MTSRPVRLRIHDSLGRVRTLSDGPDAYEYLAEGDALALESRSFFSVQGRTLSKHSLIP